MNFFRAIIGAGAVCGFGFTLHAELANGIKAVVHDSVITYQEVDMYTLPAADALRRQYRNDPEAYKKRLNEALNENMEQLIERQLILRDFAAAGYNLPESIIDEEVRTRIREQYGDRATYIKSLQAQGITDEKYRRQVRERFIIGALRGKNINSEIMISPHKIETYYTNHQDNFKVEDQIKLRMIVLNKRSPDDHEPRQLADDILAKIKEGASFSEMATVNSQDSNRNPGGERDWEQRSNLRKELSEVAFSLKPGEVSGVIETPEACWLMQVIQTRPEHIQPLSEVRGEIEKTLLAEEQKRLQKQWIERLKKKTFVRYFP